MFLGLNCEPPQKDRKVKSYTKPVINHVSIFFWFLKAIAPPKSHAPTCEAKRPPEPLTTRLGW